MSNPQNHIEDRCGIHSKTSNAACNPMPEHLGHRTTFHRLSNLDDRPESIALAYQIVQEQLQKAGKETQGIPVVLARSGGGPDSLPSIIEALKALANYKVPGRNGDHGETAKACILHYARQFAPIALTDGGSLRRAAAVPISHTEVGAKLTGLFEHAVSAYDHSESHYGSIYCKFFEHIGVPLDDATSHSFPEHPALHAPCLEFPTLLLGIGQYPQSFLPQLVGLTLALHHMDVTRFGMALIRDACVQHNIPVEEETSVHAHHADSGRALSLVAVEVLMKDLTGSMREQTWEKLRCGIAAGVLAWTRWLRETKNSAPVELPNPHVEMIRILRNKAPHAHGYHRGSKSRCLDDWLNPETFDGEKLLRFLADSPFVEAGRPEDSALASGLLQLGGPMVLAFDGAEQQVIRDWISSLPANPNAFADAANITIKKDPTALRQTWSRSVFRKRSESLYGQCTVRDLYYYLVNIERFPDILPVAEDYLKKRLAVAGADTATGERPIPSPHFSPAILDGWICEKHRHQVDRYEPLSGEPSCSREEFVHACAQAAPIIMIDGSWLQGELRSDMIHTPLGRQLFHVFYEEVGGGDHNGHHANIFRAQLEEMGVVHPPFDSREFADWSGFEDSAFEVPVLWLALSHFPRRYLPEMLGLNLAVEMAGLGASYMGARDILRHFGFNTLFVDLHNSADNVSAGHAAWAANAIKTHISSVASSRGRDARDEAWHRVWAGVRSTLPQVLVGTS